MTEAPFIATRHETIWLAGLIEGEGALDVSKQHYPRVRLKMVDRDVLEKAAAIIGTKVRMSLPSGNAQPIFSVEVTGTRAAEVMEAILPYMSARRSQQIGRALKAAAAHSGAYHDRTVVPGPSLTPA